ncbi:PQQ-binding-like beta-propeller repeat protein [Cellulosimicrobium terreum]|nr:PQQ-binding-like beta-propeller repeat protein [Cellulosimicrobium terreum]
MRRRRHEGDGTTGDRGRDTGSWTEPAQVAAVRFEIVDDDVPASPDADPPEEPDDLTPEPVGTASSAPRRRRYAHPVPWVAAAVAVLVGGSALLTSVLESEESVDVAGLPGGLHPMGEPPRERWSVPVDPRGGVMVAPGAVVLLSDRLTAYAVDDGRTLWESEPVDDLSTCMPRVDGVPRGVLVCVVSIQGEPGRARVTTVESTSGRIVGDRVVDAVRSAVAPVGDTDLVRAHWSGDDLVVVREDAATGEPRWERTVPSSSGTNGRLGYDRGIDGVLLGAGGGAISVSAPGFAATFALDGRELARGEVWTISQLRDGRYAGNEYGRGTATVFTRDGEPSFQVRGRLLDAPIDDGSAPGVLVANTFGAIAGLDAATGSSLWTLGGTGFRGVVRISGLLVIQTDTAFRGVDVTSGEEVWFVELDAPAGPWPVFSDGESLFLTEGSRGRGRATARLVSVALEDGTVRWRSSLPDDVYHVFAAQGMLFMLSAEELTAVS